MESMLNHLGKMDNPIVYAILLCFVVTVNCANCPQKCKCSDNGEKVNCQDKDLTSVPSDIPITVIDLKLSNNKLKIDDKAFHNFSKLERLFLRSCRLTDLSPMTFDGLSKLKKLYLSTNSLTEFSLNLLNSSVKISALYLDSNKLTSVPETGELKQGFSLNQMNLANNEIATPQFGVSYKSLTNLIKLDLSRNNIKELNSSSFSGVTSLQTLYLNQNSITSVAAGAFKPLPNLKTLSLRSNRNLADNALPIILKDLSNCLHFEHLTLDDVGLKNLSEDYFSSLKDTQLNNLGLNENPALTIMDPKAFLSLPHLQFLRIRQCGLLVIQEHQFTGLSALIHLNLTSNKITNIGGNALQGLGKLKFLDLSSNPFNCSCDKIGRFVNWMKQQKSVKVTNVDKYTCASPSTWSGKLVKDLKCSFKLPKSIKVAMLLIPLFMVLIVASIVFLIRYPNTNPCRRAAHLEDSQFLVEEEPSRMQRIRNWFSRFPRKEPEEEEEEGEQQQHHQPELNGQPVAYDERLSDTTDDVTTSNSQNSARLGVIWLPNDPNWDVADVYKKLINDQLVTPYGIQVEPSHPQHQSGSTAEIGSCTKWLVLFSQPLLDQSGTLQHLRGAGADRIILLLHHKIPQNNGEVVARSFCEAVGCSGLVADDVQVFSWRKACHKESYLMDLVAACNVATAVPT